MTTEPTPEGIAEGCFTFVDIPPMRSMSVKNKIAAAIQTERDARDAAIRRIADLEHELKLNASMLAQQCDMARVAETEAMALRKVLLKCEPIIYGVPDPYCKLCNAELVLDTRPDHRGMTCPHTPTCPWRIAVEGGATQPPPGRKE